MNYLSEICSEKRLFLAVKEIFDNLERRCDKTKFNLVLHRHLGDDFYCLASLKEFKKQWGEEPKVFLPRKHFFLAEFYSIQDFEEFDLKKELLKIREIQGLTSKQLDVLENQLANFFCLNFPIKEKLFVCSGDNLFPFYEYRNYWCFRWGENLLLGSNYKFSLPEILPILTEKAKETLLSQGIQNLSKAILIAPDAKTTEVFNSEFWQILSNEFTKNKFTVLVNSDTLTLRGTTQLKSTQFSLEEIVALALNCKYVFSIRSGLCDVLVNKKAYLYALYPACLRREYLGLTYPFKIDEKVNEIQFINWKCSSFIWDDIDLGKKLNIYLKKQQFKFWLYLLCEFLTFGGQKFKIPRLVLNNLFGNGNGYPDNNQKNPPNYFTFLKKIRIYRVRDGGKL